MKTHVLPILAWVLLVASSGAPALAEDGWKMPNLNPFAKKDGLPTGGGTGWKLPKLWPTGSTTSNSRPGAPSTWQKMRAGTRNTWNKTTDFLNPFDDAPEDSFPSVTGTNSAFSQATMNGSKSEKKSGSFLPSWPWGSKAEEPETVNSFLARPRPGY